MKIQEFLQTMEDGTQISVNRWAPDEEENIKAVVVLSHGMLEHALRYDRVGNIFAENGFVFSAHDHRGHGKTAMIAEKNKTGCFGLLANKDGFSKVVCDLHEIIQKTHDDFPGKKIILLGHSFGSFVAQAYIEKYNGILDGAIICGSSGPMNCLARIGKFVTGFYSIFHKPQYKSKSLQNLVFGSYLKGIPDVQTEYDWLSRNRMNIQMYQNDSWCGGIACVGFFRDLFNGLLSIHSEKAMASISKDLPIFIIAGEKDPVGGYSKRVKQLYDIYIKNEIKSVELKIYEDDRHEILNETDSETVIKDCLAWINTVVN